MTTLPQNSSLRLPRPGGTSIANIPPGAVGPMAFSPSGAPPMATLTGGDVLRVLRSNAWLIIVALLLSGAAGYSVNWWLAAHYTRYTSTGYLRNLTQNELPRIDSSAGQNLDTNPLSIELEKSDTVARLRHPSLATRLLSNGDSPIRQTDWFKQFVTGSGPNKVVDVVAATQDLLDHLDVSPIVQSRLIAVSMTYSNPRDCETIVTEVCSQHIKEMREMMSSAQVDRSTILASLHDQYEQELRDTRSRINKIIEELGEGGASVGPNSTSSKEYELQAIATEQSHALTARVDAETKLQHLKDVNKDDFTLPEIEEQIQRDQGFYELRRSADDAQVAIEQSQDKFGATNPQVVSLKARADAIQQRMAELHEEMRTRLTNSYQYTLESALISAKAAYDSITARVTEARSQLAKAAGKRSEYERLLLAEHDLNDKLTKVKDEQEKMSTLYGAGKIALVEWATYPDVPNKPSFPKLGLTLGLAMAIGLTLSLGIAFLREITNTTVRSPRDIARIGQLSLLGMIPHASDDPQLASARLPLAIFEAPYSMVAEQFRQVRTRLQHAASLDTTRSILVTGCSPQDGKSTVACNLAAGLALNGRRILLVDANFRRPELHNIFNIPNDSGFGDVLNTPDQFETVVRETEVPNLSVLVAGQRPSNPTELLESQLLIDFTERALEEYDHVIFDSGPLLIVSESNALAPRVDGVITVVRANGNSRGLLQRMRDQLRVLKAEHLGVILNAVRSQGGGYYGPMIKSYYAYQNVPDVE